MHGFRYLQGKCCKLGASTIFPASLKGRIQREGATVSGSPSPMETVALLRRQFSSPFANYLSLGSIFTPKVLCDCGRLPTSEGALLIRNGALFVHDVALLSGALLTTTAPPLW